MIDGVAIENNVVLNSYKGCMGTDRGSWASGSATALGKDLMYCVRGMSLKVF